MPRLTMWAHSRAKPPINEHWVLMNAIESGNSEKASEAIRAHLDTAFKGDFEYVKALAKATTAL